MVRDPHLAIANVLRHDYHRTYPKILWETCRTDLAPLKAAVQRMREASSR